MEIKDRIFQASIDEFRDNGVKFTMDALAKRLGISKRTLYEEVPSKKDVIELMINQTFADVKEQQKKILGNQGLSTLDKLERLFTVVPTYVDLLDYRRIDEIKKGYPTLYDKVMQNIESDWEPTLVLLQQAMDEGVIRQSSLVIVQLLLCEVFEQLLKGDVLMKNGITYEYALKEMIHIIFEGLKVR